jgi:hypothetical protein
MLKYLRIAVTALSLTVCVLLIALWVRSYWWKDNVGGPLFFGTKPVLIDSTYGSMWVQWDWDFAVRGLERWRVQSVSMEKLRGERIGGPTKLGFVWGGVVAPHWFAVVVFATLATVPWIQRFSLRTLLIATTLIAVGLGVVVMSM